MLWIVPPTKACFQNLKEEEEKETRSREGRRRGKTPFLDPEGEEEKLVCKGRGVKQEEW